jgi:hypothetical protein
MKILITKEKIINLDLVQTVDKLYDQHSKTYYINMSTDIKSSFLCFENKEERDTVFNHIKEFYINDEKVLDL